MLVVHGDFMGFGMDYPLVICYIANWKITMFRWGKLTIDGPFSVAMLVITRGQSGIMVLQQTQENIHEILCLLTPLSLKVQAPVLVFHPPARGHSLAWGLLRQKHSQHDQNEAEVGLCLGVLLEVDCDDDRLRTSWPAKNHIPWDALGWWDHIDRKELPPNAIKLLSTCKWKMMKNVYL